MSTSSPSAVSCMSRPDVRRSSAVAVLVAAFSLLLTLVVAPGATAGTPAKTIRVQGIQVPINPEQGSYEMRTAGERPGLVGWWQFTSYHQGPSGPNLTTATGTELFGGCLDRNGDGCNNDPSGRLAFSFVSWTRFDPATGETIEGGCVHPITGGTDAFAGARGLLTMHDFRDEGGQLHTKYQGTITLRGSGGANGAIVPSADVSAENRAADVLSAINSDPVARGAAPLFPSGC